MNVNGMATITIVVLPPRGCSEGFRDCPLCPGPEAASWRLSTSYCRAALSSRSIYRSRTHRSRAPGRGPQP